MLNQGRKVLKYLLTTKDEGVTYSPDAEDAFVKIYQDLIAGNGQLPEFNLFSDASFASDTITFKSTSG